MKKAGILLLLILMLLNFRVLEASEVDNLSYTGDYYNIGSYVLTVNFSPDGTKMYRPASFGSNLIYQYTLSTAWDITTATGNGSKAMSSNGITGIYFKPDGTKVYVVHFYSSVVYQYTLATPWDITTSSYDSVSKSLGTGNHYTFAFKQDGTAIYAVNSYSDDVKQFNLSSAWDLSTASATADATLSTPSSIGYYKNGAAFSSDGTRLFLVTTASGSTDARIKQYNLSTPWDVSTGSLNATDLSLSAQSADMRGLFIDSSDTHLFTFGSSAGVYNVFQYQFSPPDTTSPVVEVVSPSAGDSVLGNVTLTASSSDNVSVSSVQFYIDDVVEGTSATSSPYTISWDSVGAAEGPHTVFAVSTDSSSNVATSSVINFNVLNAAPTFSDLSATPSDSGATITWSSNQQTSSQINYGLSSDVTNSTSESDTSTRVTSHSKSVTNLEPCTDYYYQAEGNNLALVTATSTIGTFATTGCPTNNKTGTAFKVRAKSLVAAGRTKEVENLKFQPPQFFGSDLEQSPKETINDFNTTGINNGLSFNYNLRPQISDPGVKELQKYLNQIGFLLDISGPGSPGNETDYFGPKTQNALIKLQNKYAENILEPIGLSKGTGIFGKMTRQFINGDESL